jgi:preprotein translocase subunit SecE
MTTPVKFLLETRDEVQKVVWPSREQVIRLTLIVITISVAVGLYIGGLDYIFTQATTWLISK